ncbi:MAG: protein translocase subunit SecF [Kineosporiaceae bacterium]
MFSFAEFGNDLYSGRRSFDFVGRRKLWYLIAAAAVAIASLGLVVRGLELGVEFKGGADFQIVGVKDPSTLKGEEAVNSVISGVEPRVTVINGDKVRVTTATLPSDDVQNKVVAALADAYDVAPDDIASSFVGPSWGKDVSGKALRALIIFLVLVALVIALYFRTWKMALSALVALLHDLVLTVGIYAIVGFEVTPATVIGFLTILGYSLYDTVVVFDKVRENTEHITTSTRYTYAEAANLSVNQTLVRSINTSVVALLPVAAILFIGSLLLGAGTLKDLSLALFVGIAVGTYSSIFIATPLLATLRGSEPALLTQAERVRRRRATAAKETGVEGEDSPIDDAVTAEPAAVAVGTPVRPGSPQRVQPKRGARKR